MDTTHKSNLIQSLKQKASLGANILFSNSGLLKNPYKLTFACTYHCNSRCKICSIWKRKPKNELTTEEIEEFFKKNSYFNWIDLTGGEITLRNDMEKIIDIIFKYCYNLYYIHFPTNSLIPTKTEKVVKRILRYHPPKFIITLSMDGTKETHDDLRGITGNWDRVITTYKLLQPLISPNFQVFFGVTLSQYNVHNFPKIYKQVKKQIPTILKSDFHYNIAHNSAHYYNNQDTQIGKEEQLVEVLNQTIQKRINIIKSPELWLDNTYRKLAKQYIKTKKVPVPCLSLKSSIFLDPNGWIYPCSMWGRKLINIRNHKYDLSKVWRSPDFEKVRKQIKAKQCPNCWTPCEAYQSILGNLSKTLL